MADEGLTTTGLTELIRSLDQWPAAETVAARQVAADTAARQQARARATLLSPTPSLLHGRISTAEHVADAIELVEDAPNQKFQVISKAPRGNPANLPIWIEFGTSKQAARPYMRPAADAETERYHHDLEAAVAAVAAKVFT